MSLRFLALRIGIRCPYGYHLVINKRFREQAPNLISEVDGVIANYLGRTRTEELTNEIMKQMNARIIEYSRKYNEFIEQTGNPGAWKSLSQFFVARIMGDEFIRDVVLCYQVFHHFGTTMKYLDAYFESVQHNFAINVPLGDG